LPVGNSDKGVGLWAGQTMFTLDNVNQYVDWWHEVLPGSGENFDHEGTLSSFIFSPALTVGISNYWNLSFTQMIGSRHMGWNGDTTTIHHRDEGTHTDFTNAIGGYLGDFKLLARYLFLNDGQGAGNRFFLGGGLIVPSKNTLTSDPFFLSGEGKTEHRHFSMSEGVYKGVFELQYFKKRNTNPVFIGGALTAELPFGANKYGYKASEYYNLSLSALTKEIPSLKIALSSSLLLRYSTLAYWNDKPAPNSDSNTLTTGIGAILPSRFGGVTISLQKIFFLDGRFGLVEGDVDQKVSAYQLSLGYRKVFDYVIPWLDPLRDL
tara:strand:+ start:343 stop:1305 length:963 start_codon:yes stop_codon:yes gene_type:complete